MEQLSEEESLRLAAGSEVGRIGFTGRYGPVILPVNFRMVDGAVVFRTEADSALVADLRTGIPDAEYRVAFEVDDIDKSDRTGWSVMIQGPAHYLEDAGGTGGRRGRRCRPVDRRRQGDLHHGSGPRLSPGGASAGADRAFLPKRLRLLGASRPYGWYPCTTVRESS